MEVEAILTLSAAARALELPEGSLRSLADAGVIAVRRDNTGRRIFTAAEIEIARAAIAKHKMAASHGR